MFDEYISDIEKAIEIRVFETKLLELFSKGLLGGTVHTCVGQEIIGVIVAKYLREEDFVVSNHRGHGHYLARTNDFRGLLAEVMGKTTGCSGGIGGSQHLVNKNYLSNGIQGGMAPIAAGVAFARRFEKSDGVSVVFIGDGTLGQGVLYETFNICACWNIPVVFVVEDNEYAQSTSRRQTFSGSLADRAKGFGLNYFNASSNDVEALHCEVSKAIKSTREENTPSILHVNTYRLNSHSKGDDNRFEVEVKNRASEDLLNQFQTANPVSYDRKYLSALGKIDALVEDIQSDSELVSSKGIVDIPYFYEESSGMSELPHDLVGVRINEEIYLALKNVLSEEGSVLIGEDIENKTVFTEKDYGGAFKVSRDLSDLFPGRVKNTPISEAAIVGVGSGIALTGKTSIVEIMFGDFTTLIVDQIHQHASKFKKMFGDNVVCPVIVRTPMGGGRGYGPTHSQSIESIFYSALGLRIIALNQFVSPQTIFTNLVEHSKEPSLILENKLLYTKKRLASDSIIGYRVYCTSSIFPTIRIEPIRHQAKITVFCYGGVASDMPGLLSELSARGIFANVIVPTSLKPLDIKPLIASIGETNKLLVVEEGVSFGGIGRSLVSELLERGAKFSVKTIGVEALLSCSMACEADALPNVKKIIAACEELAKNG